MPCGNGQPWTAAEESHLQHYYGRVSAVVLSKQLGRKARAVRSRAFKLGLTTQRPTTEQEVEVVRAYQAGLLMKEVSEKLGFSGAQVRRILKTHGIVTDRCRAAKATGRPKRVLTEEEKTRAHARRSEGASLKDLRTELRCSKETLQVELPSIVGDGRRSQLIGERLRRRFSSTEREAILLLAQVRNLEVVGEFFGCSRDLVRRTLREEGFDLRPFTGQKLSLKIREQYRTGHRKISHRAGRGTMTYGPSPFQGRVRFRSRTEARRAAELTEQGVPWLFEACRYLLSDGRAYTPDFWIFDCDHHCLVRKIGNHPWRTVLKELLEEDHVLEDVKPWWSPTHPSFDKVTRFSREHTQHPFRIMVMPDPSQEGKYGRVRKEVWLCQ